MKTLLFKNPLIIFLLPIMVLVSTGLSAATITSTAAGGSWNATTTWVGGVLPTAADDVIIVAGSTVSIRNPYSSASPAGCNSLTVDGTLLMGSGAGSGARYLNVSTFVTIDNGGVVTNDAIEIHYISVGGDFTNNGTFIPLTGTGSIETSFTGSGSQLIDGGSSQTFYNLVVNKPTGSLSATANVTSITASTFTLTSGDFGSPTTLLVQGSFILATGTFSSGTNLMLGGRFINNGASFVAGSGTTSFNGAAQTIEGTMSSTFNNIAVTGSSSTLIRKVTVINGNLTIGDGATLSTQVGLTVNGTTTIGGGTSGQFAITSTSGAKTFVGLVTILNGATWDNSIVGGNVHFRGGLTNQGTFKDGATGVNYFETNSQSISGTLVMTNVDVNPTGISINNNGTITVTNNIGGGATWVQGINSVLTLQGTYNFPMDATASNNTVEFAGGTQNTIATNYANLILSGSGTKTLRTSTTSITGTLSLKGSASASTVTSLTIVGGVSLAGTSSFSAVNPLVIQGGITIGDACTFTTSNGLDVNGATTIGGGTSGVLSISSVTGKKVFVGKVTVLPGGTWNNTVDEEVHFEGGISNAGTFNAGAGSNYFDINSQSIQGVLSMPYLDVTVGAILTNEGTFTVTTDLAGAGTFIQAAGSVLNIQAATGIVTMDAHTNSNTVNFVGGSQTIFDTDYVNLGLSGSGTKTFQTLTAGITGNFTITGTAQAVTASAITVNGNLSIDTNCSLTNGVSLTVNGALSGAGTLIQATGSTLTINGTPSLASIIGLASGNTVVYNVASPSLIPGSYFNLNLNQASGLATLAGDILVGGTLILNTGNFDLKNNTLTLDVSASASISTPSATRMIVISGSGQIRKNFNSLGSVTFPIGDITGTPEYSPLTVNVTAASGFSSAYIAASVVNSKSTLNKSATNFLKRYWSVIQSGISGCVADVTGTYTMADVNGSESSIAAAQLDGTFDQQMNGWKKYGTIGGNTLTAVNASLSDGSTSVFTGITSANPTVSITGGNGPASCVGIPVQLGTVLTGGDPSFVYAWTPASGLNSTTSASPKAKPGSTTVYTVTVYDANGISATDNTTISVQQPTVSVNSLAFCVGGSGDLTASGALTYSWSPSTGLSGTTGSVVNANPTITTTYKVIGTDINSCTDTVTTKVTVYQLPAQPTITGLSVSAPNSKLTSSAAAGYQWFKDGSLLSGATSRNLTITEGGAYTVQVTSANGCISPLSDPFPVIILAVEGGAGTLRIYPNPTSDFVSIDVSDFNSTADVAVVLYDMLGRILVSKSVNSSDNSIDVRSLAQGTYIVMAKQNEQVVVQKVIKN